MQTSLDRDTRYDLSKKVFERIGADSERQGYSNFGEFVPLEVGAAIFKDCVLRPVTKEYFFGLCSKTSYETETTLSRNNIAYILSELGGVDSFEQGLEAAANLRNCGFECWDGLLNEYHLSFESVNMPNGEKGYLIKAEKEESDWTNFFDPHFFY